MRRRCTFGVAQFLQPLVAALLICLHRLDAASPSTGIYSPPIGPAIGPDRQLLGDIVKVTKANWDLAFALDTDEFDRTSTERLSELMNQALRGGRTILQLFISQQTGGFNASALLALSYRLLDSRANLDRVHQDVLDDVSRRGLSVWVSKYERSYTLVMSNSRLLDNCIAMPAAERTELLKFVRRTVSSEQNALKAIWQAMSSSKDKKPGSLLELAWNATKGDWRTSLAFLLAMARVSLRTGQLAIAESMISPEGGILRGNENQLEALQFRWARRLDVVIDSLRRWSDIIRRRCEDRLESVVRKFISDSKGMESRLLTLRLHELVSQLFPWRYWFILAYKDAKTYNDKIGSSMYYCSGLRLVKLLPGGQNLLLASVKISETRFVSEYAAAVLEATQRDGPATDDAQEWVNHITPRFGSKCITAAFIGALCHGRCDPVWAAAPDRLAYRRMSAGVFVTHAVLFG